MGADQIPWILSIVGEEPVTIDPKNVHLLASIIHVLEQDIEKELLTINNALKRAKAAGEHQSKLTPEQIRAKKVEKRRRKKAKAKREQEDRENFALHLDIMGQTGANPYQDHFVRHYTDISRLYGERRHFTDYINRSRVPDNNTFNDNTMSCSVKELKAGEGVPNPIIQGAKDAQGGALPQRSPTSESESPRAPSFEKLECADCVNSSPGSTCTSCNGLLTIAFHEPSLGIGLGIRENRIHVQFDKKVENQDIMVPRIKDPALTQTLTKNGNIFCEIVQIGDQVIKKLSKIQITKFIGTLTKDRPLLIQFGPPLVRRRMAQREFSSRRDSPVLLRLLEQIREAQRKANS